MADQPSFSTGGYAIPPEWHWPPMDSEDSNDPSIRNSSKPPCQIPEDDEIIDLDTYEPSVEILDAPPACFDPAVKQEGTMDGPLSNEIIALLPEHEGERALVHMKNKTMNEAGLEATDTNLADADFEQQGLGFPGETPPEGIGSITPGASVQAVSTLEMLAEEGITFSANLELVSGLDTFDISDENIFGAEEVTGNLALTSIHPTLEGPWFEGEEALVQQGPVFDDVENEGLLVSPNTALQPPIAGAEHDAGVISPDTVSHPTEEENANDGHANNGHPEDEFQQQKLDKVVSSFILRQKQMENPTRSIPNPVAQSLPDTTIPDSEDSAAPSQPTQMSTSAMTSLITDTDVRPEAEEAKNSQTTKDTRLPVSRRDFKNMLLTEIVRMDSSSDAASADLPLGKEYFQKLKEKQQTTTEEEKERRRAYMHGFIENNKGEDEHTSASAHEDAERDHRQRQHAPSSESENSDAEDERALQAFRKLKKEYNMKVKKGISTQIDSITFLRAQEVEKTRLKTMNRRRRQQAEEEETLKAARSRSDSGSNSGPDQDADTGDEGIFLSDSEPTPPSKKRKRERKAGALHEGYGSQSDDSHAGEGLPKKKSKPGNRYYKERKAEVIKPVPKKHVDASMQEGLDAIRRKSQIREKRAASKAKNEGKRAAKASPSTGPKKARGKGKQKATAKSGVKKTRKPRAKKYRGPNTANVESLLTSDVFESSMANIDQGEQPALREKLQSKARMKLIASLPVESRDTARADASSMEAARRKFSFPHRVMIDPSDGLWRVKGMETSLKHFQMVGVGFMRSQENGVKKPQGGIIADQMGLGKTVSLIANMVDGKPGRNAKHKTTLIVVPVALAKQWMSEIRKYVNQDILPDVYLYKTTDEISNNVARTLQRQDIVITTYTTVRLSYPTNKPPMELSPAEQAAWWEHEYETKKGPLHQVFWHRIILDEAQAVKNYDSQSALAVRGLMGKHRWICTGSPLTNDSSEWYSLFKFLQVEFTGSKEVFSHNYLNSEEALERLKVMLSKIMLRRTYDDKMFDQPILKLPPAQQHDTMVDFSMLERGIYDIVARRCIRNINGFVKDGTIKRKFYHVFHRMLLLRQLTGHIFCIDKSLIDILTASDVDRLVKLTNKVPREERPKEVLINLKKMLRSAEQQTKETQGEDSIGSNTTPEGEEDLGGKFGTLTVSFKTYLKKLREDESKWAELKAREICAACQQPPEDPHVLGCFHVMCEACLTDVKLVAEKEERVAKCTDIECDKKIENSEPCTGLSEVDFKVSSKKKRGGRKKKSTSGESADLDGKPVEWIEMGNHLFPSAKTLAIKAQILLWFEGNSQTKIIIYTQFRMMMRILERLCMEEGWGCCTYYGSLDMKGREKALKTFKNDPGTKILIASLKAGGVGLNLTEASKVLMVDLWWNSSMEQQAFCRVYRIGQTQPTTLQRLVVKNTIDENLVRMQNRKARDISAAMGGDCNPEDLSIEELLQLFGQTETDEEGNHFIIPSEDIDVDGEDNSSDSEED